MSRSIHFSINDASAVGDARREAALLCQQLNWPETDAGKVGIIVTEAGKNLLKHAVRGQMLLRRLEDDTDEGVEIMALDQGPGMADVAKCMTDGYSTAGSPGTGLGAIVRLSTVFDIYSQVGKGTVLVSRLWSKGARRRRLEVGVVCAAAIPGDECGDAWSLKLHPERARILLADGLGHGVLAARAADEAVRIFVENQSLDGLQMIQYMHGALRSTRGASLAIADMETGNQVVRYYGVGNISATILQDSSSRSLVSHNGTVGHELHTVREFTYPWSTSALLVMHSDGLTSRWKLDAYPGLASRHPSVIAGVLFRDYQRGKDDASVVVVRQRTQ